MRSHAIMWPITRILWKTRSATKSMGSWERTNMQSRINIYTSKEDRKLIDNLKVKYQLSLTTIIDVLCDKTEDIFFMNGNKQLMETLKNVNIYGSKGKTSIKEPRIFSQKRRENDKEWEKTQKSRFANNVLHIYLNKDIHKYIKNATLLNGKYGYWNSIEQELKKRVDNWWNYNQHVRYLKRFLKENPKERQI